jgi:hypothetical protein
VSELFSRPDAIIKLGLFVLVLLSRIAKMLAPLEIEIASHQALPVASDLLQTICARRR